MKLPSRLLLSVATASVLTLGLAACGSDEDTSSKGSSSQESSKEAEEKEASEEDSALTKLTSQAQSEMDSIFEQQLAEYYSKVTIEPSPPSTVIFRYVYKDEADMKVTKANLDKESKALSKNVTEVVLPSLEAGGIEDPAVTYVYENPDGTVVWERTFPEK